MKIKKYVILILTSIALLNIKNCEATGGILDWLFGRKQTSPAPSAKRPPAVKKAATKKPQFQLLHPAPAQKGLNNDHGNDCFANASFQCLSHCKQFMDFLRTEVEGEVGKLRESNIHKRFLAYVNDLHVDIGHGGTIREWVVELLEDPPGCGSKTRRYVKKRFPVAWSHDKPAGWKDDKDELSKYHDGSPAYGKVGIPQVIEYTKDISPKKWAVDHKSYEIAVENTGYLLGGQCDAQEYVGQLIDTLTDKNNHLFRDKSLEFKNSLDKLKDIFYFKQTSFTERKCRHTTSTTDPTNILQFSVPKKQTELKTLFDQYFEDRETLTGIECEPCSKVAGRKIEVDTEKYFRLLTWPRILILHLKRFGYDEHRRQKKINITVTIPTELTVGKTFLEDNVRKCIGSEKIKYNLFGVLCHGGDVGGGHYWAYTKGIAGEESNHWYEYNDSSSTDACNNILRVLTMSSNPYLLFYELDSTSPSPDEFALPIALNLLKEKLVVLANTLSSYAR
jgi:ubiquitin C-terminal hydrolase